MIHDDDELFHGLKAFLLPALLFIQKKLINSLQALGNFIRLHIGYTFISVTHALHTQTHKGPMIITTKSS